MAPDGSTRNGALSATTASWPSRSHSAENIVPFRLFPFECLSAASSLRRQVSAHAYATRTVRLRPDSACVLGTVARTVDAVDARPGVDRTYCVGRRDRPDPTVDIIDEIGSTYVDSRERRWTNFRVPTRRRTTSRGDRVRPPRVPDGQGACRNEVGVLLGSRSRYHPRSRWRPRPRPQRTLGTPLSGTVNPRLGLEDAVETLQELPAWLLDELVTTVTDPEHVEAAFEDGDVQIQQSSSAILLQVIGYYHARDFSTTSSTFDLSRTMGTLEITDVTRASDGTSFSYIEFDIHNASNGDLVVGQSGLIRMSNADFAIQKY